MIQVYGASDDLVEIGGKKTGTNHHRITLMIQADTHTTPCPYCNGHDFPRGMERLGSNVISRALYYQIGDGQEYNIPIYYCPACGRRIVKKGGHT